MMLKTLRSVSLIVFALLVAARAAAQDPAALAEQIQKSANPELVGALTKEKGATVSQASGAAGAVR